MSYDGISRRYFFFGSLLAGAAPLAGQGSVPSLRALGYKPYYDKLNVASVGCGGQGGVDLNAASLTENQGFSHECDRVAAETVWSGAIGDVLGAHISTTPGTHPTGLQQVPPESGVPPTLDWDLWIGASSMRPYSDYYVPYNWRGFWD